MMLTGWTLALPAVAAEDIIERVVAVVNDEAVFLSQVRKRAIPFLPSIMEEPSDPERDASLQVLYARLTTALVNEELIEQAAREMQVRVTNDDVDRGISNVRSQNQMTEDQFWQAVRAQGFTEAEYRRDVRRQILRLKVLNTRARGRVNVSETEVREAYELRRRRASRRSCFSISARAFRSSGEDGGADLACAQAEQVAQSASPGDFGGDDLGVVCEGSMQPQIEAVIRDLEEGGISEPIRSDAGCLLVLLKERVSGEGDVPSYEDLRDQIYRALVEQAMAREEGLFLEELRRDAVIDERL